ncbi:hypothetical protein L1987_73837 [Smallanthus sonchifolius]|uniref:Uncharacterized protein n=2 Tax=Smallanthus sonchifolius TaxID=185202 RepID=A0ACB9A105_9ASTR|nr:hypothetical protein L1987_73831 [Smallanthus sonchifolius]KAI3703645.1 hypothetical protein L1987_73837 [Smallanthus sonchifolius]
MNGRICSCKIEHPPHMFDEMLQRIDFLHWSTKPLFSLTMFSLLDYVVYKQIHSLAAQFLVLDASSVIIGLFLCYVGFSVKNERGTMSRFNYESLLDSKQGGETRTPSATSNIFSLLTFSWMYPLISVGYKKRLDLEDVPQLDSLNSAQRSFSVLRNKLELDKSKSNQISTLSLVKAVTLTIWKDIIITGLLCLVSTLAAYVGPFLINTFVKYLNGRRDLNAGLLVSAFCVAALVAMIHHKGLTLSSQSKQGHSNGEIINFMAVDAERIVLVMLSNIPLGRFQEKFQAKLMEYKDKRMKTTSEILKNMRILKLHGWEMKFLSRIDDIRSKEAHWLYKFIFTMALSCCAFWVAPTLVAITTFGTSMLAGIPLDSGKVLSAVATFKNLQDSVYNLPDTISMIAQTKVSLDLPRGSSDTSVEIADGNFSWDVTSCNPTLTDMNFKALHRMKIARALYQDADIYLFDDPFIAVDAITGNHLFKECMDFLESKTVIYVTYQVEFLPSANLILVLKDGRITQAGMYDDIIKLGSDFLELVGAHKEDLLEIDSVGSETMDVSENHGSHGTFKRNIHDETVKGQNGKLVPMEEKKRQLVVEEERKRGKVGSSAYWKYLTTAYGGALTPLILLAHIMFESSQISSNYWLAWASSTSESNEVSGFEFLIVYVAFGIGCSICILANSMLLMQAGYETANRLFYKMHFSIFRAPMAFFDANPSGRILSRVSTDQTAMDLTIPYLIGPYAYIVIQLLGVILVMSLGAWSVFLVFIPVVGICIWLQQYYIPSARELARLVGVYKAPVIQHFSETISGSTTIRSFDQKHRFQDTCLKLIDNYSRPKFHVAGALAWLGLRLDMLSSLIFAFLLVFLVTVPERTGAWVNDN